MKARIERQFKNQHVEDRLQKTLLVNGTFSGMCGFFMIMMPNTFIHLLGITSYIPKWAFVIGGAILAFYGCLLYLFAMLKPIPRIWVIVAIALDFFWVVGSLLIIFLCHNFLSQVGPIIILAIALMVAALGYFQWRNLDQAT